MLQNLGITNGNLLQCRTEIDDDTAAILECQINGLCGRVSCVESDVYDINQCPGLSCVGTLTEEDLEPVYCCIDEISQCIGCNVQECLDCLQCEIDDINTCPGLTCVGTVTGVCVNDVLYNPTTGIVTLPDYPDVSGEIADLTDRVCCVEDDVTDIYTCPGLSCTGTLVDSDLDPLRNSVTCLESCPGLDCIGDVTTSTLNCCVTDINTCIDGVKCRVECLENCPGLDCTGSVNNITLNGCAFTGTSDKTLDLKPSLALTDNNRKLATTLGNQTSDALCLPEGINCTGTMKNIQCTGINCNWDILFKLNANTAQYSCDCPFKYNPDTGNLTVCKVSADCLSANCDVSIGGDLTVAGTITCVHAQEIDTSCENIKLRYDATTALPSGHYSGVCVTKYNGTDDFEIGVDCDGTLKIGTCPDNMEAVATRDCSGNMENDYAVNWNCSSKMLTTDGITKVHCLCSDGEVTATCFCGNLSGTANNSTCFNGCTYAEACADIRSGLIGDACFDVYCCTTCKCRVSNGGSLCLGKLAFCNCSIPTVNNKTISFTANGSTIDSFTLNQNTDKTICLGSFVTGVCVYCGTTCKCKIKDDCALCLSANAFNANATISTSTYPGACCTGTLVPSDLTTICNNISCLQSCPGLNCTGTVVQSDIADFITMNDVDACGYTTCTGTVTGISLNGNSFTVTDGVATLTNFKPATAGTADCAVNSSTICRTAKSDNTNYPVALTSGCSTTSGACLYADSDNHITYNPSTDTLTTCNLVLSCSTCPVKTKTVNSYSWTGNTRCTAWDICCFLKCATLSATPTPSIIKFTWNDSYNNCVCWDSNKVVNLSGGYVEVIGTVSNNLWDDACNGWFNADVILHPRTCAPIRFIACKGNSSPVAATILCESYDSCKSCYAYNAEKFGGCTYAEACTNIRSGLVTSEDLASCGYTNCTGTVTSVNGCSGSVLTDVPGAGTCVYNKYCQDSFTTSANRPLLLSTCDCNTANATWGVSACCKILYNPKTGVLCTTSLNLSGTLTDMYCCTLPSPNNTVKYARVCFLDNVSYSTSMSPKLQITAYTALYDVNIPGNSITTLNGSMYGICGISRVAGSSTTGNVVWVKYGAYRQIHFCSNCRFCIDICTTDPGCTYSTPAYVCAGNATTAVCWNGCTYASVIKSATWSITSDTIGYTE